MKEDRYGYRVRQVLNHGLKDIPPAANRRLEAARHLALAKQKQAAPQLVFATAENLSLDSFDAGGRMSILKQGLAILALLLGMWLSFYWHSVQYVTELEEVDSALLSDDIPPEAFMDDDFIEWLKDDSSEG